MSIVFKPGTSRFFISFVPITFFECLCSLLWSPGCPDRTQPLFYYDIAGLYLSYYSSSGSLNQLSLLLVITITSPLKRLRIATFSADAVTSDTL